MTNPRLTSPDLADPVAVLAAALHDAYHTAKEAGAVTVGELTTLMASHALTAMPDWTLVPVGEHATWTHWVEHEATIARLRAALANSAEFAHFFALGVPSTTAQHLPGPFHSCQAAPCAEARAAALKDRP